MRKIKPKHICGSCTQCCSSLGVKSLNKKDYEKCEHLCSKGCSIYKNKPTECGNYKCFYFINHKSLDVEFRPDHLGVIIELQETKFGLTIIVRENYDNASKKDKCINFLNLLQESYNLPLCIIGPNGRRSLIPNAVC